MFILNTIQPGIPTEGVVPTVADKKERKEPAAQTISPDAQTDTFVPVSFLDYSEQLAKFILKLEISDS